MPVLSSTLKTQANAQVSKTAFSNKIKELLGSTRRVRCFYTPNASADPYATGTEFLNAALTGEMIVSVGDITHFGVLGASTVNSAVDLAVGAAVLRIEGGGHSITYTLGLVGSGKEFTVPSNPAGTTGSGFAFTPGSGMKAPMFLPSGIGPAAPAITADTVVAFRIMDYTNESAPVSAGIGYFDTRDPDLTAERPWIAREMGDVRMMRCADNGGVVLGTGGDCYKFAGHSYLMDASVNSEALVPVNIVEIRKVPHNRWASFPFLRDVDHATDTLIPPPHKIELLRADGTIKDVIENYAFRDVNNTPGSGKPINYAAQKLAPTDAPIEPFDTASQVTVWYSHRPKPNTMRNHLIPAVESDVFHPTNVKQKASYSLMWPVITDTQTYNGWNVLRVAPKWARRLGTGFDTAVIDTNLAFAANDGGASQAFGWGHKPGSDSLHTWYMAPGGVRSDRAYTSTQHITWLSDPTGTRIHGGVPHADIAWHFTLGYFNHGVHWFTDVIKGLPIDKDRVLNNRICYNGNYYGGSNENYVPDLPNNAVRSFAAYASNGAGVLDKYGRRMNNEYSRDYQHNQSNGAKGAYLWNSPPHLIEARHFFTGNVLATSWLMGTTFGLDMFMTRQMAWYEGQFIDAWIGASNHPRCLSSSEIENMWQKHLEMVHDAIMPGYLTSNDIYFVTLRNLGVGSELLSDGTTATVKILTDSKALYMGQVLMLWKQSGAWDVMRAKSAKCAAIMDLIVTCCLKLTVDFFQDSNGRYDYKQTDGNPAYLSYPVGSPIVPTNWGVYTPPDGGMDWIRRADGQIKPIGASAHDHIATMHFRAQALIILQRFFGERNYPRMDAAVAQVRQFYADIEAARVAGTGDQWDFRFAMMGIHTAPDYVGPPV